MERIKKEIKERVMERIRKAGDSENYETSWNEEGKFISKKKTEIKKGKKSKTKGASFELKVRKDLEAKGRIVDKWTNNVGMWDKEGNIVVKKIINKRERYVVQKTKEEIYFKEIIFNKIVSSKKIFNPFKKIMIPGAGFPDFISIKHVHDELYSVIGVEVKINGVLSKIEKEKCVWYLRNKIFSQIWIAKAVKKSRKLEIEYNDFNEKYGFKFKTKSQ